MRAMRRPPPRRSRFAAAAAGVAVAVATACAVGSAGADPAAGHAAFAQVASVLRHPRCLNCHPASDVPRVGDDRRPHAMNVVRGSDGGGVDGMRCSGCHQDHNQPLVGVPGAPHWKLAPLSMGWEGLDDHALAEALKDRARNGGRSLEELHVHVVRDPLVKWGWDPGPDRSPPPLSHEDFSRWFGAWLDAGAPSPPATGAGR